MTVFIISCCAAYLIGSVPSAYIVGKLVKKIDIREYGSGNIGATNIFRVVGKKWGLIVLALDILKGIIATLFIYRLFPTDIFANIRFVYCVYGACAIIGHNWTIFLQFKGGKGVATTTGVVLALFPEAFGFSFLIFFIVVFLTRFISLGSLIAAGSFPVFVWLFYRSESGFPVFLSFAVIMFFFLVIRHKNNISRLVKGTENKISFK